jgi:hypothetical protein
VDVFRSFFKISPPHSVQRGGIDWVWQKDVILCAMLSRPLIAVTMWLALCGSAIGETVSVKYRGDVPLDAFQCATIDRSSLVERVCYDEADPPALEILSAIERRQGSEFVFPTETGGSSFQGTEKVWQKLRAAVGMPDLRLHDLRHSFASAGLLTGSNLVIIGKLLGHADVKTTARYAHLADDPLRQAAASISNRITSAMEGGAAKAINLRKPKT